MEKTKHLPAGTGNTYFPGNVVTKFQLCSFGKWWASHGWYAIFSSLNWQSCGIIFDSDAFILGLGDHEKSNY